MAQESYQDRLRRHSSEERHDPLRDAARRAVKAYYEETPESVKEFNDAMGNLREVLESVRRGGEEPQEDVPDVEVTYEGSPLPVEAPERPPEARRSGAKNVSAPEYQNAFISEARRSMGQPSYEDAVALLGKFVKLTFNIDWRPAMGVLTQVNQQEPEPSYLLLDNYLERRYPLNAIQEIKELPHEPPGTHPSGRTHA